MLLKLLKPTFSMLYVPPLGHKPCVTACEIAMRVLELIPAVTVPVDVLLAWPPRLKPAKTSGAKASPTAAVMFNVAGLSMLPTAPAPVPVLGGGAVPACVLGAESPPPPPPPHPTNVNARKAKAKTRFCLYFTCNSPLNVNNLKLTKSIVGILQVTICEGVYLFVLCFWLRFGYANQACFGAGSRLAVLLALPPLAVWVIDAQRSNARQITWDYLVLPAITQ